MPPNGRWDLTWCLKSCMKIFVIQVLYVDMVFFFPVPDKKIQRWRLFHIEGVAEIHLLICLLFFYRHACCHIFISRWCRYFRWGWSLQQFFECPTCRFLHRHHLPITWQKGPWKHEGPLCRGGEFFQPASTQQSRKATTHQRLYNGFVFSNTVSGAGWEPCFHVWHSRYIHIGQCLCLLQAVMKIWSCGVSDLL